MGEQGLFTAGLQHEKIPAGDLELLLTAPNASQTDPRPVRLVSLHPTYVNPSSVFELLTMAPRRSKPAPPPQPTRTLVIDNGAHTLKAGFVTADTIDEPTVIPNCIARDRTRKTYVASDLSKCKDFGEIAFRRPVDKGYIVNWETQKEVWDHEFFNHNAPQKCDPAETRLILTEQPNSIPALQTNCDQMVFEEFGFASYYRGIGKLQAYLGTRSILEKRRPSLLNVASSDIQRIPRCPSHLSHPRTRHGCHEQTARRADSPD